MATKKPTLAAVPPPAPVTAEVVDPAPAAVAVIDDAEIARRLDEVRHLVFHAPLPTLVANRERINKITASIIDARGSHEVPSEIWQALEVIDDLVGGKVDRLGQLVKVVIPAKVASLKEAFKAQLAFVNDFAERLDGVLVEALKYAKSEGRTMVEGETWRARLQTNSAPSTDVLDPTVVPTKYKKRAVTVSFEFDHGDEAMEAYWAALFAGWEGRAGFNGRITDRIDTAAIVNDFKTSKAEAVAAAKAGKEAAPFKVAGVRIELGEHARLETGKNKATAQIKAIKIPALPATPAEGAQA